jgi:hypothetical protein
VASLGDLPAIDAVVDAQRFAAQLDSDAVSALYSMEVVNELRQGVAASISRGDYAKARQELKDVDYSELEAAGFVAEETEAFQAVDALRREVEAAAAAPAEAQHRVRNAVGKSLYQQGTDARRKGAKR